MRVYALLPWNQQPGAEPVATELPHLSDTPMPPPSISVGRPDVMPRRDGRHDTMRVGEVSVELHRLRWYSETLGDCWMYTTTP